MSCRNFNCCACVLSTTNAQQLLDGLHQITVMDILNYRPAAAINAVAIREHSLQSYGEFEKVQAPEYWEKMSHGIMYPCLPDALMDMAETFVCDTGARLARDAWGC